MFNSGNGNGMGWGMRRQPVEEHREFNQETEVAIPVRQAIIAGIAAGYAVIVAPVIAMVVVGESVFWLVAGVWCFSTFFWYLRRSGNLVTEDNRPIIEVYDNRVCNSLIWLEVIAGICMSIMVGFICGCIYKVLFPIIPERSPWFSGWVFTLLGIAQLPAAIVTAALLIMAFTLELAQRSPWQEQHMWAALADIVRGFGLKAVQEWWREPVLVKVRENGNARDVEVKRRPMMTPEQQRAAMMREFIEVGAESGFSRRSWVGSSGRELQSIRRKMTDSEYRDLVTILDDANILTRSGSGTRLNCSTEEAISRIIPPYGWADEE